MDTDRSLRSAPPLPRPDPWAVAALAIAALVLLPILSVLWIAFAPGADAADVWKHLVATTLPRYLRNTFLLMGGVGLLSAAIGTGAAWLVVMHDFPARRFFEWALLLPLAIPAYIGAYALVDFLEYAGPVQTGLRELFGWRNAADYWFPEIRSLGAAVIVLTAALSPYVYLLVRAALMEQSAGVYEVARALGAGPWGRFLRVGLPLSRPALAAGVAIVMMETVNDFGTVDYFAVQTLTTGIFTTWMEAGNVAGAAQIAVSMLTLILLLVLLEKISRRRLRFYRGARQPRPIIRTPLAGWRGWLALTGCTIPFAFGFLLPGGVILSHAFDRLGVWTDPALLAATGNTVAVAGSAALVTLAAAIVLVYGARLARSRLPRLLLPVTTIGYAAPGAVLGIGILIPLAAFDNALADLVERLTGRNMGLILTGTAFGIVLAYMVRFFALALGAVDSAFSRLPPSLPMAARSLGETARGTLLRVHLPLMRSSIATALLLVFVDGVKELPATLILRPFDFNTLATHVYEEASLENLEDASPAALLMILVGLASVFMIIRTGRLRHGA